MDREYDRQDNRVEVTDSTGFPRIDRKFLAKIRIFQAHPRGVMNFLRLSVSADVLETRQKPLADFLKVYAQFFTEPEEIRSGAQTAFSIFFRLEGCGFKFPEISQTTIKSFSHDVYSIIIDLAMILDADSLFEDKQRLFEEARKRGLFPFLNSQKYAYENPELMKVFSQLSPHERVGAMTLYELYRREFQADELEK